MNKELSSNSEMLLKNWSKWKSINPREDVSLNDCNGKKIVAIGVDYVNPEGVLTTFYFGGNTEHPDCSAVFKKDPKLDSDKYVYPKDLIGARTVQEVYPDRKYF